MSLVLFNQALQSLAQTKQSTDEAEIQRLQQELQSKGLQEEALQAQNILLQTDKNKLLQLENDRQHIMNVLQSEVQSLRKERDDWKYEQMMMKNELDRVRPMDQHLTELMSDLQALVERENDHNECIDSRMEGEDDGEEGEEEEQKGAWGEEMEGNGSILPDVHTNVTQGQGLAQETQGYSALYSRIRNRVQNNHPPTSSSSSSSSSGSHSMNVMEKTMTMTPLPTSVFKLPSSSATTSGRGIPSTVNIPPPPQQSQPQQQTQQSPLPIPPLPIPPLPIPPLPIPQNRSKHHAAWISLRALARLSPPLHTHITSLYTDLRRAEKHTHQLHLTLSSLQEEYHEHRRECESQVGGY